METYELQRKKMVMPLLSSIPLLLILLRCKVPNDTPSLFKISPQVLEHILIIIKAASLHSITFLRTVIEALVIHFEKLTPWDQKELISEPVVKLLINLIQRPFKCPT